MISAENTATQQSTELQEVVSFSLGGRNYALPLKSVAQIIPMVKLTPLPQAHYAIQGIMNFRGQAVPVINMRRYLGLPEAELQLHTPIILTQTEHLKLGLIVDEVLDVMSVSQKQIAHLADIMPEGLGQIPMVEGLTHLDAETILLLNLKRLFTPAQVQTLVNLSKNQAVIDDDGRDPATRKLTLQSVSHAA